MADIVVRDALPVSQSQRQERLSALQRLDLDLLVYARDQRLVGQVEIQAHDVVHLHDEKGVVRQFESLGSVRLLAVFIAIESALQYTYLLNIFNAMMKRSFGLLL